MSAKPKLKTCRNRECAEKFIPRRPLQVACCPGCAIIVGRDRVKAGEESVRKLDRAITRQKLEAIKPRSKWFAEVQAACNAVVRERDCDDGCISCDKPASWDGQWHASHYLSVGAHPETRFDLSNIHKSCSVCNNYLSGNIRAYRPRLIDKIGMESVEWLEGPHMAKKYTIDDLRLMKAVFQKMLKSLQQNKTSGSANCTEASITNETES